MKSSKLTSLEINMLQDFEDWLAVRIDHDDKEMWPARISFSLKDGITINTINFASPKDWYSHPTFRAATITGYLDYQKPITIISPFIKRANPGSIGTGASFIRARYDITATSLLKNFHLKDISERCFYGFDVQLPAFQAWIDPNLTRVDYDIIDGIIIPKVEIELPIKRVIIVNSNIKITINTYVSASKQYNDVPVSEKTVLSLQSNKAYSYEEIMKIAAFIDIVFSFLIGVRLKSSVHLLSTSKAEEHSAKNQTAECWIVPKRKRLEAAPPSFARMFVEDCTPIAIGSIFEMCVSNENDNIYLMDIILSSESNDGKIDELFVDIIGYLEEFDTKYSNEPANPKIKSGRKRLRKIIERHGTAEDLSLCDQIGRAFSGKPSLKKRLERLVKIWREDGFRGNPDLNQIIQLRNTKSHGRGRNISIEEFQLMHEYSIFLCALGRYHILKSIGFDRESISHGFIRMGFRYGGFVPDDFRSSRK